MTLTCEPELNWFKSK